MIMIIISIIIIVAMYIINRLFIEPDPRKTVAILLLVILEMCLTHVFETEVKSFHQYVKEQFQERVVEIPPVAGYTQEEAVTLLEGRGLKTEISPEQVASDAIEAGLVAVTDPAEGTKVKRKSKVTLVLSSGPAKPKVNMVTVPNVVEISLADAKSKLKLENLEVGNVSNDYSDSIPEGYVISQDPRANGQVEEGTVVTLIVSKGPKIEERESTSLNELSTSTPKPTIAPRTFEADDLGPDDEGNYLEHFSFTDKEMGSCNIYNTRWVQFNVAWKTAEWDDQNSDIDLEIRVRRANGDLIDTDILTPSRDDTGKDADGYYYVGSKWFDLFPNRDYHDNEQFKIEYVALTSGGQRDTGIPRSGDIHVWVKLGSKE